MLTPPGGRTALTLVTAALLLDLDPPFWVPEALAAAPVVAAAVPLPLPVLDAGAAVFEAAGVAFAVAAVLNEDVVSKPCQQSVSFITRSLVEAMGCLLLLELSCRRTIKPSMPKSFSEGGHGHADVTDVNRKSVRSRTPSRDLRIMAEMYVKETVGIQCFQ